jgi:hypothetical protein
VTVVRRVTGEAKPLLGRPRDRPGISSVVHPRPLTNWARRRGGRPGGVGVQNHRPSEASLPQEGVL